MQLHVWAQTWYDDRYCWTLCFDTSLNGSDLESRSQGCGKAKTSTPIISQSISGFGMLLRLVLFNEACAHFILSNWLSRDGIQVMRFCFKKNKQTKNIGLQLDIYRPISFKLGMVMDTTELHSMTPVWNTLTPIEGHVCMKKLGLLCSFSCKFQSVLMK